MNQRDRPRVGFLTYDLQEFAVDCLTRISAKMSGRMKAYPVFDRLSSGSIPFSYRPSRQQGRFFTIRKSGSTPEGFTSSINWAGAWSVVWENDIVVLFGIQGATALLATLLAVALRRHLVSVNQTLPPNWERQRRWWVRLLKGWILDRCQVHVIQTPVTRATLMEVYKIDEGLFIEAPFESGAGNFCRLLGKIKHPRVQLRKKLGWQDDECIFLFVGTLLRFKGIETILQAARKLKGKTMFKVICIGPPPAQKDEPDLVAYRALAALQGVAELVSFPGKSPMDTLVESYVAADACILPTQKDCWPKVLVEAALAGLPLVTTDACGAAGALVVDNETGFVVPPADSDALTDAMRQLFDPNLRLRLGSEAKRRCMDFCDGKEEAAGYVKALQEVW